MLLLIQNTNKIGSVQFISKTMQSVTIDANTRTIAQYNYPDDLKSHKKVIPITIDTGTGYAQGTFSASGDTYCVVLIHNIGPQTTNNPAIIFAVFD